MISYKIAKNILYNSNIDIKDESITCLNSLNRVCSSNIYSPFNYPSGNNAAFDGFAVNSSETINLNKKNSNSSQKPAEKILRKSSKPKYQIFDEAEFTRGREVLGEIIVHGMLASGGTDIDWLID